MTRFIAAAFLLLSSSAFAGSGPVGEKNSYVLNKSRSHRLIKAGVVDHTVTADAGDVYDTSMYCRFDVTLVGRKEGTGSMPFPKETFDPAWMEELRTGGVYEGPGYKVVHQGYGTARTADGRVFENCDKIRVYDIDTSNACIQAVIASFPAAGPQTESSVEMVALVKAGQPILGFVQLDLALKNGGSTYQLGLDLK
jgi:hypothetical protein